MYKSEDFISHYYRGVNTFNNNFYKKLYKRHTNSDVGAVAFCIGISIVTLISAVLMACGILPSSSFNNQLLLPWYVSCIIIATFAIAINAITIAKSWHNDKTIKKTTLVITTIIATIALVVIALSALGVFE